MTWKIYLNNKVKKQLKRLPEKVVLLTQLLSNDLGDNGYWPGSHWPNYGKLGKDAYHCHLAKGRPTYVACWRVLDKSKHIIEVYYVGTHENVPY